MVPGRGGMPGVYPAPALAGWVRLPALRRERRAVDDVGWAAAVPELSRAHLADGRHDLRGHAQAAADVVPGDVVRHQPEERRQRPRPAAGARAGQLRDRLDVAAQAAPGDGPAGPRSPRRRGRGRRNLRRRPGKGQAGPGDREQGHRRGGGRGAMAKASAASACAASRTCRRTACCPSSQRRRGARARWSTPMAGAAMPGWRRPATSTRSPSSAAVPIRPTRSCRASISVASLLKRWLIGTHQGGIQHQQLDYYLDEFTFRFNRRRSQARGAALPSPRPAGRRCRTGALSHHHRKPAQTGQICALRSVKGISHFRYFKAHRLPHILCLHGSGSNRAGRSPSHPPRWRAVRRVLERALARFHVWVVGVGSGRNRQRLRAFYGAGRANHRPCNSKPSERVPGILGSVTRRAVVRGVLGALPTDKANCHLYRRLLDRLAAHHSHLQLGVCIPPAHRRMVTRQ